MTMYVAINLLTLIVNFIISIRNNVDEYASKAKEKHLSDDYKDLFQRIKLELQPETKTLIKI